MSTSPRPDRAASSVEYALLGAGVAALLVLVILTFGTTIRDHLFGEACDTIVTQTSQGAQSTCARS